MLSIITVNYAGSRQIAALKESLLKNPPILSPEFSEKIKSRSKISWEWIVVDNFSTEGEVKNLQELLFDMEAAHLVTLHKNYGYGSANAEGVRFAHGEYLAIVNPDIEMLPKSCDELVAVLAKQRVPTVCVPVLRTSTGQVLKNTRKFPNVKKLLKRRLLGGAPASYPAKNRLVDWAQGSFWVLRKDLFEALGGFDERFFLFFEDTDFCRRLQVMGGQVLQVAAAEAIHSPNRLSGGNVFLAVFRRTFWIHIVSAGKYFLKWR